jgi:hypothetical protein
MLGASAYEPTCFGADVLFGCRNKSSLSDRAMPNSVRTDISDQHILQISSPHKAYSLNVPRELLRDEAFEAPPTEGSATGLPKQKLAEFPFDPASHLN